MLININTGKFFIFTTSLYIHNIPSSTYHTQDNSQYTPQYFHKNLKSTLKNQPFNSFHTVNKNLFIINLNYIVLIFRHLQILRLKPQILYHFLLFYPLI